MASPLRHFNLNHMACRPSRATNTLLHWDCNPSFKRLASHIPSTNPPHKNIHTLSLRRTPAHPLCLIHYNRPLIATTRPKITVTSPAGQQIAAAQWHTWSDKIDLVFSTQGRRITYQESSELTVGSLARLPWILMHASSEKANMRCTDRTGAATVTIVLHDKFRSGEIGLATRFGER